MLFSWSAYEQMSKFLLFFSSIFPFISFHYSMFLVFLYMTYPLFLLVPDFFRALLLSLKHLCRLCNRFRVESLNSAVCCCWHSEKGSFWTSNATSNELYTQTTECLCRIRFFQKKIILILIRFYYDFGIQSTIETNSLHKNWRIHFMNRFFSITAFIPSANNFPFSSFVYGSFSINRLQRI